jgi:hypothetical protein
MPDYRAYTPSDRNWDSGGAAVRKTSRKVNAPGGIRLVFKG